MKDSFIKFLKGFKFAFSGLIYTARRERNFRFHLAMALYVAFFAIIGNVSIEQTGILCVCVALVLALELLNTALELACDKICPEKNDMIKNIKDVSAGAVLVGAFFSAIAGLCIFLSKNVWNSVFKTLFTYPYLIVLFIISVVLNLIFIFKKSARD